MGGFWYPGATTKPLVELLREYEDSVGHNSNYLLEFYLRGNTMAVPWSCPGLPWQCHDSTMY